MPENCHLWASQLDVLCRPHRVVVETMYSPKIDEEQIQRLYRLRETMRESGEKATMTAMVRDAIEEYLTENEKRQKETDIQLDRSARIDIMKEMRELSTPHQLDTTRGQHRVVGAIEKRAL